MLVKINVADAPEMRERFNTAGLPTVILAKPGGEEIDRTLGFIETEDFISTIQGYHEGIGTLTAMMEESKTKSGDPKFLLEFGKKLYAHNRVEDADAQYLAAIARDSANTAGVAEEAAYARIRVAANKKDYELGMKHCRSLASKWPNSKHAPESIAYLGWFATKAGKGADAVKAFEEYLKKWPEGEDAEFCREELQKLTDPPSEN